jgi:uncharacterized membrane protein
MGKLEYLDALKRAMTGLAPEIQARTLAYYEQRFIDGLAAGRSEADIARDLDDPKKIAITLRASSHMHAFEQSKNPANLLRLIVSAFGLIIFNLFMVVPAMVYAALLATVYACALAFYVAGIAVTASGLSGANELVLDGPLRHFILNDRDDADSDVAQTNVSIGENGIQVLEKKVDPARDGDSDGATHVIRRAEAAAGGGIHISTDMDAGSRTTQSVLGIGMVLGAILLFLIGLVLTKYTFIGLKRYIEMNFSLLKGS